MMSLLTRARVVVLMAILVPASATLAQSVDVWTVGVNNTRQGWNRFETVLNPTNVRKLRKLREFTVDEKIDVSPLVVADKLYVFTMTNTAFIFDVNSGAELQKRQLAPPFDPADIANPPKRGMDLHNIYRNWGITATPVIDVASGTIYVTTFGKPNGNSPNIERNNMLWILDANTLADRQPPVLIAGASVSCSTRLFNLRCACRTWACAPQRWSARCCQPASEPWAPWPTTSGRWPRCRPARADSSSACMGMPPAMSCPLEHLWQIC